MATGTLHFTPEFTNLLILLNSASVAFGFSLNSVAVTIVIMLLIKLLARNLAVRLIVYVPGANKQSVIPVSSQD
jgi:hypothetical protein